MKGYTQHVACLRRDILLKIPRMRKVLEVFPARERTSW